jgi:pyrroline-5-carboxylate reductase
MSHSSKIALLGAGNIGISIVNGLLKSKAYQPEDIIVTRRRLHMIEDLADMGVVTSSDNVEAVKAAEMIIVAVKPHQAPELFKEICPVLEPERHILVSTITGVTIEDIRHYTENKVPVFLVMPNTAIALCESMTCIGHDEPSQENEQKVIDLFNQLGRTLIIPEDLMGAATVLAACGIAFALRFLRSISQGGIEIGFGAELSTLIAAQTLKGASRLILESGHHPEREIDKVTTPLGITISGLNEMEHNGFSSALIKGLITSYKKIEKVRKRDVG